jgi:diguanylate cyclase (GGDEF)-like protein
MLTSARVPTRITLRLWLTLPYVALVTSLSVVIGMLSYQAGSQAVDAVADNLLLETMARIGQAIDRHVVGSGAALEAAFPKGMAAPRTVESDMVSLRERFWIATSLHLDPNNYVYYGNRQGQFFGLWRHSAQEAELRLKLKADEPRQVFHFTDIAGDLSLPVRESRQFDPRERPWYKAGASNTSHIWTATYIDFRTAELVATRARRVVDAAGTLQGVVATDMSLRKLNDFVRGLKTSENAVAFIIEPDGQLIASSRTVNVTRQPTGTPLRLSAADSADVQQVAAYEQVKQWLDAGKPLDKPVTRLFTGAQGEVMQLAFQRLRDDAGLNWITVVTMPRNDFMRDVISNVMRTAWIGAAAAGVALALGLGILSWITRDLGRLAAAARQIGEGKFDAPLAVYRADEIGDLASSFRKMQQQLSTDKLTGLVNREALMRAITARIERRRRAADECRFAVLFIDLDNFKLVNDQLGHAAGDRALIDFAVRLRKASRSGDLVARYAGDEFVMMMDNVNGRPAAELVRDKIETVLRKAAAEAADVSEQQPSGVVSGTVGVAAYPFDGQTADELVRYADADMYTRKSNHKRGR